MPTRRRFPWISTVLLLAVVAGAAWGGWALLGGGGAAEAPVLHLVARGPLKVTVLESGSLEALSSTTIASQVEGQAAILFLVPEGTILTPEDVAQHREIVRLDGSDLEAKLRKQKIEVESARAATVNAEKSLVIQQQEDASKERQAVLQVEFARLDLRRAIGVLLAERLEEQRRRLHAARTALARAEAQPAPHGEEPAPGAVEGLRRAAAAAQAEEEALIHGFLEDGALAGETLQKLRALRSDISLADEELKRAQVKWDWSKRLLEKDFVSRDEENADRLAYERRRIEQERAVTAHEQFATYDYPKAILRLLSDLVEAEGELARVRERARAAQNRAEAEVAASRQRQTLQEEQDAQYKSQLAACSLKATVPGLVLYATSTGDRMWDDNQRIKEGTTVRQRQPILVIPDTDQMGVRLNIHESVVEKVREGLRVTVTVDAAPDRPLKGTVDSIKSVPNATDRWMNPDLKVYTTMVRLEPTDTPLRPGLSAKAEILVEERPDVLSVPVQSIAGSVGRPSVWVWEGGRAVERPVTLGSTNDRFVEITSENLAPGERVLLAPPRSGRSEPGAKPARTPSGGRNGAKPAPAPGAGAAVPPAPAGAPAGAASKASGERPRR